ncbi:hypothetical protein Q3G72_029329 [Acer saccharum]|nr:hypothetical protein Q3G72_029329 [Acer saccharum]
MEPRFSDQGKHGNKIHLDSGKHVFLYQIVGTLGQLSFQNLGKSSGCGMMNTSYTRLRALSRILMGW